MSEPEKTAAAQEVERITGGKWTAAADHGHASMSDLYSCPECNPAQRACEQAPAALPAEEERPRTNYCRYLLKLLQETFPSCAKVLTVDPRDGRALARPLAVNPIVGAEVGVALGHLSNWLLHDVPGLTLWMVDAWRDYPAEHQYRQSGDKRARLSLEQQLARMEKAQRRVSDVMQRARIVRAESVDAAGWLARSGVELDFVFIDGSHTYQDVAADLRAWWPLVKPGGLFSGHDYGHHKQHGVKIAVDEFFAAHGLGVPRLGDAGAESVWSHFKTGA